MEKTVSATKARVHFGEMIRRVADNQERIIVERAGKPQLVMISVAQYERLKATEAEHSSWLERVQLMRKQIADEVGERPLPPAEKIVEQMREERNGQLTNLR